MERSLQLNPNSAGAWMVSGMVHPYAGDSATAIAHFERSIQLNSLDPLVYVLWYGRLCTFCNGAMRGIFDSARPLPTRVAELPAGAAAENRHLRSPRVNPRMRQVGRALARHCSRYHAENASSALRAEHQENCLPGQHSVRPAQED
jgi:hypothetical protein